MANLFKNKYLYGLILCGFSFISSSFENKANVNDSMNGTPSNTRYQENFSDILLVVHFNHPYYANIDFLKNLYSKAFKHIVFYGEKEDPQVYNTYTHDGYLLSGVIEDVFTRFPDYKGYLFIQDDCVLHYWNYLKYDLDKIWFAVRWHDGVSHGDKFFDIKNLNGHSVGQGSYWWVWDTQWGINAVRAAYGNLSSQDKNTLNSNVGHNNVPAIMCETFYIPHRFKTAALRINSVLKNVFCEIEVPTMLCCLDSIANWQQLIMLGGAGVGYGGIHSAVLKDYPTHVDWVHPMKFSQKDNRDGIAAIFERMTA